MGKVMASVFWYKQGIVFMDCLEKRNTINGKYYIALLKLLEAEMAKKSLFYRDNARRLKSKKNDKTT